MENAWWNLIDLWIQVDNLVGGLKSQSSVEQKSLFPFTRFSCQGTAHACWDKTPPDNRFFLGTGLCNHVFANEQGRQHCVLVAYIS